MNKFNSLYKKLISENIENIESSHSEISSELKNRIKKFVKDYAWSLDDKYSQNLLNSKNEDDVRNGVWQIASYVGEKKGWFEEGIGELHNKLCAELGIEPEL
jgi:hypothetical protein